MQVYPLARGTPPLFIALWSALFLGERLPFLGYVGIALLMVGIYLASLRSFTDVGKSLRSFGYCPMQFALLAALCVSVYSTRDKIGVSHASPYVYNVWVYAGIAIGYAPFVWSCPRCAGAGVGRDGAGVGVGRAGVNWRI